MNMKHDEHFDTQLARQAGFEHLSAVELARSRHRALHVQIDTIRRGKTGQQSAHGNMGTRHFYVRSRFPEPRFEIISVRIAREIGPACVFGFQSFEISADNHLRRRSHKETNFRIGRRERCLDSRPVELAMRFTTASLRNTLCRSDYVHKRSSKIPHHG